MDALNEVLKKLSKMEAELPKENVELEVKKAIIQHFHQEGYEQADILNVLNEVLQPWKDKTVTIGCVKHHLKQSK